MGASLATQKKLEESLAHFRMAVEIAPDDANAHYNLATALQTCNAYDEATIHYRKALTINPEMTAAHCNFASLLARRGRMREALEHYQKTVDADARNVPARNNLAWLLATYPDASIRNGTKAVELARQAVQLTGDKDPATLDTLATAYAETGRFAEAVKTAKQALELAVSQNRPMWAGPIKAQIRLFKAGTPFRDTLATGAGRP